MKRPLIYSAILHLTILVLLMIGFYNPFQKTIPAEQPVMIEFVQIAEQSAAPQISPETIQDQPLPAPPQPTPAAPQPQPEPPRPEPTPQPQPEPEPVKPTPQPQPEPEIKPEDAEPIPDPKAKPKPKEKPKEEKPKPQKAEITLDKKKKETSKTDDQNKDKKKKPSSTKTDDQKDKKKKPSKSFDDLLSELETSEDGAPSKGKGAPATSIGPVLTASEKDALSRHMSKCWIIPSGLRDARNIRVPIKINVARDGTVQKAEIVDKARMGKDPAYRTAAESARRAVLDPHCSPLPIPPEKYEMFKEFIFNFDPKEMF